ncbi:hypothetical protein BgAZ_104570 [Babesia gibsoni]|uniref:Uncharacterized protein n=1 Tax=Babesia gibsoni TaxID=33632 RepID=A0AAD8UT75_BABGI|nr:hypothetical protein BgAZ_104570 [Babesia gibsoni]
MDMKTERPLQRISRKVYSPKIGKHTLEHSSNNQKHGREGKFGHTSNIREEERAYPTYSDGRISEIGNINANAKYSTKTTQQNPKYKSIVDEKTATLYELGALKANAEELRKGLDRLKLESKDYPRTPESNIWGLLYKNDSRPTKNEIIMSNSKCYQTEHPVQPWREAIGELVHGLGCVALATCKAINITGKTALAICTTLRDTSELLSVGTSLPADHNMPDIKHNSQTDVERYNIGKLCSRRPTESYGSYRNPTTCPMEEGNSQDRWDRSGNRSTAPFRKPAYRTNKDHRSEGQMTDLVQSGSESISDVESVSISVCSSSDGSVSDLNLSISEIHHSNDADFIKRRDIYTPLQESGFNRINYNARGDYTTATETTQDRRYLRPYQRVTGGHLYDNANMRTNEQHVLHRNSGFRIDMGEFDSADTGFPMVEKPPELQPRMNNAVIPTEQHNYSHKWSTSGRLSFGMPSIADTGIPSTSKVLIADGTVNKAVSSLIKEDISEPPVDAKASHMTQFADSSINKADKSSAPKITMHPQIVHNEPDRGSLEPDMAYLEHSDAAQAEAVDNEEMEEKKEGNHTETAGSHTQSSKVEDAASRKNKTHIFRSMWKTYKKEKPKSANT